MLDEQETCTGCHCALMPENRRVFCGKPFCGYCYVVEASEPDWRWPPTCGDISQNMRRANMQIIYGRSHAG